MYDNKYKNGKGGGKFGAPPAPVPTKTVTSINEINRNISEIGQRQRHSTNADSFNNISLIVGTDVSIPAIVGIYKNLEVTENSDKMKTNSGLNNVPQTPMIDYSSQAQFLVQFKTNANHEIMVSGVELCENNKKKLLTAEGPFRIGDKIAGASTGNDTIVVHPLQIMQSHGVSNSYQAIENGLYVFGGNQGRMNMTPEVARDISSRKALEGGVVNNITPVEISKIMSMQNDLAIKMRSNLMGFTESDVGKDIVHDYVQGEINAYMIAYSALKTKIATPSLDGTKITKTSIDFDDVINSPDFIYEENRNKSRFNENFATFQITSISNALKQEAFSSPEQIAMAEEQLKYYSSYKEFSRESSKWESEMIDPIKNTNFDGFTDTVKNSRIAYLSGQNGFTEDNYKKMDEAYKRTLQQFRKSLSLNVAAPEEVEMYTKQIAYLGNLIRIHPENPINKPLMPLDSSVDSNIQKIDSSLYIRMKEYNNREVVRDEPSMALSLNILAKRDRCEDFIKRYSNEPGMKDGVEIAKSVIANNSYQVSQNSYDTFIARGNEVRILNLIANSQTDGAKVSYKELIEAANDGKETLKGLLCQKAGLDYSYADLSDFFNSEELQAAIRNPEQVADNNRTHIFSDIFVDANTSFETQVNRQQEVLERLTDPVKCQEMKQQLIKALDETRTLKRNTLTLERDIEFLDNHIIENRMRICEAQRNLNNYDFDNIYGLHVTDEQLDILKKSTIVDSSNPEKFKSPDFVLEQMESIYSRTKIKVEKGIADNPNNEMDSKAQDVQASVSEQLSKNAEYQTLKEIFTSQTDTVKYSETDIPKKEIDEKTLYNEMLEYGQNNKHVTFNDMKEKFGDREYFDGIIQEKPLADALYPESRFKMMSTAKENFKDLEKKAITIEDCVAKIEKNNENAIKSNGKHSQYFPMEILKDDTNIFDTTNPVQCQIIHERLMKSGDAQLVEIGTEMKEIMNSMENNVKMRVIPENCKTAVQDKDLSITEISSMRDEAQRAYTCCLCKSIISEEMDASQLIPVMNREVQDIKTVDAFSNPEEDISTIGSIFSIDNLAAQREGAIEKRLESVKTEMVELRDHLDSLYNSMHTSDEAKDKKIVGTVEAIQSTGTDKDMNIARNELNQELLNNRFYVEHVSVARDRDSQIEQLVKSRDKVLNPDGFLGRDALAKIVEETEVTRFSPKALITKIDSYKESIAKRDAAAEAIDQGIESLQNASKFTYSKDPETLYSGMNDYANDLAGRIKNIESILDAATENNSLKKDLTVESFTDSYYRNVNDIHEGVEINADKDFMKRAKQICVNLSDNSEIQTLNSELASYKSELHELEKCQHIVGAQVALSKIQEVSSKLTLEEVQSCQVEVLGKVSEGIKPLHIGAERIDCIETDFKNTKSSMDDLNLVDVLNSRTNRVFIEQADKALDSNTLDNESRSRLVELLAKYDQYNSTASGKEVSSMRAAANESSIESFTGDKAEVITESVLQSKAFEPIRLPDNVSKFHDENIQEISEKADKKKDLSASEEADREQEQHEKDSKEHHRPPDEHDMFN